MAPAPPGWRSVTGPAHCSHHSFLVTSPRRHPGRGRSSMETFRFAWTAVVTDHVKVQMLFDKEMISLFFCVGTKVWGLTSSFVTPSTTECPLKCPFSCAVALPFVEASFDSPVGVMGLPPEKNTNKKNVCFIDLLGGNDKFESFKHRDPFKTLHTV